MKKIDASLYDHRALNEALRAAPEEVTLENCCGQRFIGTGFTGHKITIEGVPGNALGAYLNGGEIIVHGNAQDAVGDTMNAGRILIHGSIGDAAGYAMRGGEIYVRGDAGYRAGIHMKEYNDKRPVMVIGGTCGSFLGEYQAGGMILVLGLSRGEKKIVSNFPGTGMHGGKMFLRARADDLIFPSYVTVSEATKEDLSEIGPYIEEFCRQFGYDADDVLHSYFTKVVPDSKNPYKQMYAAN